MEDTDVDMGSLPEDVKEKLAELALELSEGRQNILFISLLAHPKHFMVIKLGFNFSNRKTEKSIPQFTVTSGFCTQTCVYVYLGCLYAHNMEDGF